MNLATICRNESGKPFNDGPITRTGIAWPRPTLRMNTMNMWMMRNRRCLPNQFFSIKKENDKKSRREDSYADYDMKERDTIEEILSNRFLKLLRDITI